MLWARISPSESATPIEFPVELDPVSRRYELVEATRLRIGDALTRDVELTRRLSPDVLRLLLLESNRTDQLVHPLIAALGRRRVLDYLIQAARVGEWAARANAASAAYWVRAWAPRRPVVDQRDSHYVADLWPDLWLAALEAFVHCPDVDLQEQLHTAFPLGPGRYPPEAVHVLRQARAIAVAHPDRFARLLDGSTGYGAAI
ncbi:hypothetical protein SRB5_45720 [Streptomyces sp. RB5]|uniref:Uncharacterized protein n=2 Tax=Streptomyces smaragdinus TaxID=2585196 RepID=A0A7K0CLP3_9ACTN|nr:hypothetical protein [Streptomyces smaragdinus]